MPKMDGMDDEVIDIPDIDNHSNNNSIINAVNAQSSGSDDQTACQVCGLLVTSRHFGATACRACGAFFRRCITMNRKYTCRCGLKKLMDGMMEKPMCFRIFCRACRFQRCLEIGMRPEAVRAADYRRFHEERRATTSKNLSALKDVNGEEEQQGGEKSSVVSMVVPIPNLPETDWSFLSLLNPLLPLGARMHRISISRTLLPFEFYNKFTNLETLIECKENILDHYSTFSDKRPSYWPREFVIKMMEEMGFEAFVKNPPEWAQLFQNLFLSADMIKIIPVFSKLELADQKALLKNSVRKVFQLFMAYFSMDFCPEAMVWSSGANLYEIFAAVGRHYNSNFLINSAYKIFINPMKLMGTVRPSNEEFSLLLALLVSNPASPSGLSQSAQVVLNEEAEKYAKVLMQLELNQFGQSGGPLRYMDLQSLLWNAISCTYTAHEMYAYLDTVLHQGCFHLDYIPVIFRQFLLKA